MSSSRRHASLPLDYRPPPVPNTPSYPSLREAVQTCRACDLWEGATQAARGKRRIHQKPDRWHVSACLPWLEAELEVVRPEALVCLGATAAQALLSSQVRIGRDRGRPVESDLAELVTITTHPSAILRAQDDEREQVMNEFVADLTNVASWLSER
jgi:uracil-DNA glycosylase